MEAGTTVLPDGTVKKNTDLIDVMYATADDNVSEEDLLAYERTVCPTCGSCAGMFTANSMNCLTEAMGLALPGNGTTLASHAYRKQLFEKAGRADPPTWPTATTMRTTPRCCRARSPPRPPSRTP